MKKTNICVFCGSSSGIKPQYERVALDLGKAIAKEGYGLVYGGGGVGLMGAVAKSALKAGAPVVGIMPKALIGHELPADEGCPLELTDTMQQRKRRMLDLSEAFVVLPGGVGTMDEFFEIITEATLGLLPKPIVLVDVDGYYAPLVAFMQHMVDGGFVQAGQLKLVNTVKSVEETMACLNTALAAQVTGENADDSSAESKAAE